MAEIKYALFIEPKDSLLELIQNWKKFCAEDFPGAPYLSHPPHSTLLYTYFKSNERVIELLKEVTQKMEAFPLVSQQTIVFENDALAGGGHTLAIRANADQALLHLQMQLSESVVPEIELNREILPEAINHGLFAESFSRFGFPFVGQHWIPHFSIASIKADRSHQLIRNFESQSFSFDQEVNEISLWEVKGDEHQKITSFKLGTS
jgi:hypothetical protein